MTIRTNGMPAVAAALVTLALVGCTGPAVSTGEKRQAPTPTATDPADPCPIENPVPWGDVIAKAPVEDDLGEYCHVTVDPESAAFTYDAAKVDVGTLSLWGFTEDDAQRAQQTAVTFVAEEILDSPYLDNPDPTAIAGWFAATDYAFSYLPKNSLLYNAELPVLLRDGGARSRETRLEVTRIIGQGGKTGDPAIAVAIRAESFFRLSDEAAITYMLAHDQTGTREELVREHPEYADGEENLLPVTSLVTLYFNDRSEISGHGSSHRAADAVVDVASALPQFG